MATTPVKFKVPPGLCLQEQYALKSVCFGCGPANEKGLKIRSFYGGVQADAKGEHDIWIAQFKPQKHQEAFPGVLNGGIIGALLDCHSNWAASHHLMKKNGLEQPPCSVTAEFKVKLLRPTPTVGEIRLVAWIDSSKIDRAQVKAELWADEKQCATCEGLFVAVRPDHPAYHRW